MVLHYETIVQKIQKGSELSKEEVEVKIKKKLDDLQGLISKEGAGQIVANELNIKLFDSTPQVTKIENLEVGSNAVILTAKILQKYDIRSFNKNNRQGRVANLLIGDETAVTRLVIWDEHIIEETEKIQEGDIIKLQGGYVRQNQNYREVHLGNKAQLLVNPEGEKIETVKEVQTKAPAQKITLKEARPNNFIESYGYIVQVFEPRYYHACPNCNKKVLPKGVEFVCQEHGNVVPQKTPIVNIVIDDGTECLRAVCFRQLAQKIVGTTERPYEEIKKENEGRAITFRGKVTRNDMFDRTELMLNSLEEANPVEIMAEISGN